ncbi:hypothetical protein ACFFV7_08220 [Nonomuraea spiralis]|uniref:Secreted protein n=1 Tax=Nonomuraea spiralis TaxID=46182 RepID=A0ABV5I9F5_9ACTN|nr:hypothetical protein [Nonomuraea spiralis]GGT07073.1 hypothetical protein GCM10010176_059440 [Nonomuraea spiralis]
MGSRTAISAGVLAVALGAIPAGAPAASAAAQDCTRDGGLLSGVTNTLCDVVGALTGTVDDLTGGATEGVTKGVEDTTGDVLGTVGDAVPTGRPGKSSDPARPSPSPTGTGLVPETLKDVCLPVLACDDQGVLQTLAPRPTPTISPEAGRPERSGRPRERTEQETAPLPTQPPTPPRNRPYMMDDERPVTAEEPTADPDDSRVELLWPNPFARELAVPLRDQRVVRPSPPASDVLGTVLTIVLLGSAVLATRIVQQRRHRAEPSESIPFEPAPAGSGRHRLA